MKKRFIVLPALLLALALAGTSVAADIAVTTLGQSPDGMMVAILLTKIKVDTDYSALLQSADLKKQKALILVVGGSIKGLQAAGIDEEQEKERGLALIRTARADRMKILVMHVGGSARRSALTDMLITAVVPLGDRIIVVKPGNADGLFSRLTAPDAELNEVETLRMTLSPLQGAFTAWGIRDEQKKRP